MAHRQHVWFAAGPGGPQGVQREDGWLYQPPVFFFAAATCLARGRKRRGAAQNAIELRRLNVSQVAAQRRAAYFPNHNSQMALAFSAIDFGAAVPSPGGGSPAAVACDGGNDVIDEVASDVATVATGEGA